MAGDPAWQTSKVPMAVWLCALASGTGDGERILNAIARRAISELALIAPL